MLTCRSCNYARYTNKTYSLTSFPQFPRYCLPLTFSAAFHIENLSISTSFRSPQNDAPPLLSKPSNFWINLNNLKATRDRRELKIVEKTTIQFYIVTIEIRIATRFISFYLEPWIDVKLWVAETFSRKRILLNGEDKRAFSTSSLRDICELTWNVYKNHAWWSIALPMHPWTSMLRATIYYTRFPSWREWMFEAMVCQIMTRIASNNLFQNEKYRKC